ncbi:MAG: arsenosugar biosynthesis radical SAM protein ArsS [Thermodesulfovibrionia bacterium]
MDGFNQRLKEIGVYPLKAVDITTLQVNIGYKCNLMCTHCHVEASPVRQEMMSVIIMSHIIDVLEDNDRIDTVDITGGSPELNPYCMYLVNLCVSTGKKVIVRTNLTLYAEPAMRGLLSFYADKRVKIIASLPCYTEEGVDRQRGRGSYQKIIMAMKELNSIGYGKEGSGLELDIMFNPFGAEIAPDQKMLEDAYKQRLWDMHGVVFNHLLTLNNMPIGRFGKSLSEDERLGYMRMLEERFNPNTVDNLMCRHLISVSPDGRLFDCDFWQMLNIPVKGECSTIDRFDYDTLSRREIVTSQLCFMCTAGAGASCTGALT